MANEPREDAHRVRGETLTLVFDTERCVHARRCVTRAPKSFLSGVEGEWLFPDESPPELLQTVAEMCPSGAVKVIHHDGTPDEQPPEVNLCHVRENGPLALRASLEINGDPDGYRATLCRCGQSKNKPWCDFSHVKAEFEASGEAEARHTDQLPVRGGTLSVRPQIDGPLMVMGPLEICGGAGSLIERTGAVRLCRCGASGDKPFCDNSHARIGFKSENEHDDGS